MNPTTKKLYKPYHVPYVPAKKPSNRAWATHTLFFFAGLTVASTVAWLATPHPVHGTHEFHSGNPRQLAVWTSDKLEDEGGICGLVVEDDPPTSPHGKQQWIAMLWNFRDHGLSQRFDSDIEAINHVDRMCTR